MLLVSNLILVNSFIVTSRSYVDKLAPVEHYSVFELWTVIALKYYYDEHITNTGLYIGRNTCITVLILVHHTIVH